MMEIIGTKLRGGSGCAVERLVTVTTEFLSKHFVVLEISAKFYSTGLA